MINLIVPEYCQSCADFDPQVTQGPEQLETGYGGIVYAVIHMQSASIGTVAKPFMSI